MEKAVGVGWGGVETQGVEISGGAETWGGVSSREVAS